jgi:hypothetical protein
MVNDGCFADGTGCEPREETVSETQDDEAVVFEEFFMAGLRMPPHPVHAEYMVCRLFPLPSSFKLGEVVDRETPVSKLLAAMMDFPVAQLLGETNDHLWARVELAAMDMVGRYTHGEHQACVEAMPNQGRVNWVFEHTGVPYGPCLAPGSETSEEAAKKRKQDAGAESQSKHVRVLGRQTSCVKVATVKAAQSKSLLGAEAVPNIGVPPKTTASTSASVSKAVVTVTSPRVRVLKIGAGEERPSAAPSEETKGKHARLNIGPSLSSVRS